MNKTLLSFILPIVFLISCSSPTIEKQITIGGDDKDEIRAMCLTKDGGFIVGGTSFSQKQKEKSMDNHGILYSDYWVIKFNAKGEIQWDKTIGGIFAEYLRGIATTDDGGYIIAGESSSGISGQKSENSRGSADIWIVKLDSVGNIQWDKTLGGAGEDICNTVRQTSDGGYILGGASNSNISGDKTENCRGDFDFWAIKLDKSGNIQWNKTLGGNKYEFCGGVELNDDGSMIFCGVSASDASGEKSENNRGSEGDSWIIKLDSIGNIQWDKTYGGKGNELAYAIRKNGDDYLLACYSNSDKGNEKSENSKGSGDYWIVKIDGLGNKIWDKTIGGKGNDDPSNGSLQLTQDGGYIIGGMSDSGSSGDKTDSCRGYRDFWVVKIDKAGKVQWDKTIGGNDYDELKGIEEISKNHFVLTGLSYSGISGDKTDASKGASDYWIIFLKE